MSDNLNQAQRRQPGRQALPVLAATAAAATSRAATGKNTAGDVAAWLERVKNNDEAVYGPAWQEAARYGAPAVRALVELLASPDFELIRRAKRALGLIVHSAGRPKNGGEAKAVQTELLPFIKSGPLQARRDVLWLLSEIADDKAVPPIAELLSDKVLREDARCVLIRLPGRKSLAALESALKAAPNEFKPALADSLRARGLKAENVPSRKMVPTAQTTVESVKPKQ